MIIMVTEKQQNNKPEFSYILEFAHQRILYNDIEKFFDAQRYLLGRTDLVHMKFEVERLKRGD